MRELEFAGHPSLTPARLPPAGLPLPRMAFVVSVFAHVLAGYALIQQRWASAPVPPAAADFFLFELPPPAPVPVAEPVPAPVAEAVPEPAPPVEERVTPEPPPRAAEVVPPREVVVEPVPAPAPAPAPAAAEEPAPASEELAPATELAPPSFIDFEEVRRRAAREVVEEGLPGAYMTFSLDDIAPPREQPKEPEPSIFDVRGGPRGPSVGQVGQSRTKVGHRVAALCNALTGGFSLMGWGSFCAGPRDSSSLGLYPEVRPEYLDMLPECVDTRDTAPALALEAPFPTVKCRLVRKEEIGERP